MCSPQIKVLHFHWEFVGVNTGLGTEFSVLSGVILSILSILAKTSSITNTLINLSNDK